MVWEEKTLLLREVELGDDGDPRLSLEGIVVRARDRSELLHGGIKFELVPQLRGATWRRARIYTYSRKART